MQQYLEEANREYQLNKSLTREALHCFRHYRWPGNLRELNYRVRYLAISTEQDVIEEQNVHDLLKGHQESNAKKDVVSRFHKAVKELLQAKSCFYDDDEYGSIENLDISESVVIPMVVGTACSLNPDRRQDAIKLLGKGKSYLSDPAGARAFQRFNDSIRELLDG